MRARVERSSSQSGPDSEPERLGSKANRCDVFKKILHGKCLRRAIVAASSGEGSRFDWARNSPRLNRKEPHMQQVLKHVSRAELAILAIAVLAFALLMFAGPAFAGADTTFDTALTKFTDFLEGSGGKIITVLSLAGGVVALASGRFSMGQIAIPVGVGVGAGTGVPIVTSTVTATI